MTGPDAGREAALERYLARLERALAALPPAERREIVLETRSHVAELVGRAPERGADAVLAELGAPESYARRFLPDGADRAVTADVPVVEPSASPRPGTLLGVARLATGGWRTLPLLVLVAAAYGIALVALLIAIDKLAEPEATGLFVAPGRSTMFVISDPRHEGRDVLGFALVPIALGVAVAIHLAVSTMLRWYLRRDARRRS